MTGGQAFRRYGELDDEEDVKFGSEPIWMGLATFSRRLTKQRL